VAIAGVPHLYNGEPANLYDFCKELVAVDLGHSFTEIVMPHASETSMEQLAPSDCLLLINNRCKLLVLAEVQGYRSIIELAAAKVC